MEKYKRCIHSTLTFSRNIDQMMKSHSEAFAVKTALKGILMQMFSDRRPPPYVQSMKSSPSPLKRHSSLRLIALGVVAVSRGILAKVDRMDVYKELGPSVSELVFRAESDTDHSVGICLLFDKKVRLMQEITAQRKITGKNYPQSLLLSGNRDYQTTRPSVQSIGVMKKTIYASHFVQNAPISRVDSLLSAYAQMNFTVKSSLPRASPTSIDSLELQESHYLRQEQVTKKLKCLSPSPVPSPAKSPKGVQSKSMLETVTGVSPGSLRLLDASSRLLMRDSGTSLKELSRELSLKR